MIILSFFTKLLLLFSRRAGPFQNDDELGLFQTSWAKSNTKILIVNFFLFRWVGPSPDELDVADELVEGLTHNTLK